MSSVESVNCCRSFGEQGGEAEIPLRHFPLAAGAKGRVDVEFEVEPKEMGCLVLTNSFEDSHEGLRRRELLRSGLIAKPVAAGFVVGIGQADAVPHALQRAEHFSGLPPGAVEQQDVLPRPVFSCCRRSLVRKWVTGRMEDPEMLASRQDTSRPA
jgi:hypothetical protein